MPEARYSLKNSATSCSGRLSIERRFARRSCRTLIIPTGVASNKRPSRTPPTSVGGPLISAYVEAPALSPVVTLFPSRREGREISKQRGTLLLQRRLTLKIPQLKLGVLREF